MKITLHRAENKRNVLVEIATAKSKILLDGGVCLDENEVLLLPELQEQYSFNGVDAVFLSHYNSDHVTMARGLLENVPTYAGALAGRMAIAAEGCKAKKPFSFAGHYKNGAAIAAGDITVTPFLVDDAVHEGYLLLIEGEGRRVIYTGDYHSNGRLRFEQMLVGMPEKIDVLICEGGVLTDEDSNPITERSLEEKAAALISEKRGPVFVLQGVGDFDRLATLFSAAKRSKRVFLEDLYLSEIARAAGAAMPNPADWDGVRAYLTTGYKPDHFRYKLFTALPRMNKGEIASQKFVMCIRPSMKKYLKTLSQELRFHDGIIFNALPDGSASSPATREFLAFAAEKGLEPCRLRRSGHADAMAIRALVEATKPMSIIPLERENAPWFAQQYPVLKIVDTDSADL